MKIIRVEWFLGNACYQTQWYDPEDDETHLWIKQWIADTQKQMHPYARLVITTFEMTNTQSYFPLDPKPMEILI